jgi:PPOX class probable F420-dependent enzyme
MAAARVARLATVDRRGQPHIVPVTFALVGDGQRLVTAVDQKPKSTTDLRRLRNVGENPRVSLLGDHYSDDWRELWWVRVDGAATVIASGAERDLAVDALMAKYSQYRDDPPEGPVIDVMIESWTGWEF